MRRLRRGATSGFHLALIAASAGVWVLVGFAMFTFGSVKPDEVGVLVNNLWGTEQVYLNPGTYLYNAITSDLITLDKSEQTIEFTRTEGRGDRQGRDDIRVKTKDGSDVDVDVTVNYSIIPEPEPIGQLLALSGPDERWSPYGFSKRRWDGYKSHWIRDYVRTYCRYKLGELTTEEMYDSALRTQKALEAKAELNAHLNSRGLQINSVQIQAFNFYDAYQQKIRDKKLADQEVEEEKSKRNAAMQEQATRRVEAEKRIEVKIAEMKGDLSKALVRAKAEAKQKRYEADAQLVKATQQAGAIEKAASLKAEGIRAQRLAEAKGIEALKQAFSSREGALNLVMMEYAKRLQNVKLSGSPVSLEPQLERFQHTEAGAARRGR